MTSSSQSSLDHVVGRDRSHVVRWDEDEITFVHSGSIMALTSLSEAALAAGFQFSVASSFRDLESQLGIWNSKVRGARPVFDSNGKAIDISTLTKKELLYAILRWSALPGASRHHWGTDFDVFDRAGLKPGETIQLQPFEIESGGSQEKFGRWLRDNLNQFGFFRPYEKELGGVSPEWWHISHSSVALRFQKLLTREAVELTILGLEIELKDEILKHLPEIYSRFIVNITR